LTRLPGWPAPPAERPRARPGCRDVATAAGAAASGSPTAGRCTCSCTPA